MILYEYPFNERIRTLLRLEDLFERFTFFLTQEDPREHHAALTTLFEIAEVAYVIGFSFPCCTSCLT